MCDICSKTFKRKEALDNHAIVHQDLPKDFKCVTCGAAFNSQQYLNRHISRHFAEKKHKCRDCDMAFIDKRDYIGMISHKMSLLTIFGLKHKIKNFIFFFKKFQQPSILVYTWNKITHFHSKLN